MKTTLTERQKAAVERMEKHVTENVGKIDVEQRFRDMLDEIYDFKSVGGPFVHLQPSRVLEEMYPVDFRCGVADMSPDETMFEIGGECYDIREVEEAAEEFRDELQSEIDDMEAEIEDDDEPDRTELDLLIADLEACKHHVW